MTKDEALMTDRFHRGECQKFTGPRGGVKIRIEEWRRNGANRTWKSQPDRFRIPIKYGMRGYGEIVPWNVDQFHAEKDCPING